ncbi:MAG TPA: DNA cytosine methyltransferase [Acidimicrobiales bacterium]|nr:DNA cytosine methyltransferase [Acidimicrobiales bacterium]
MTSPEIHNSEQTHRRANSIDLFVGAGGLAISTEQAGFRTVAAVDLNADAIASLRASQQAGILVSDGGGRRYLEGTRIVSADVARVTGRDLRPAGAPHNWRPDLLTGGPPCQPFSSAGRQRGLDDPRGGLLLEFVRLAADVRPRYVLFENVRGLLTQKGPDGRPGQVLELVQASFEEIGYAVRFGVLNAADYGAAQRRVRLYMIGTPDHHLPEFPAPTHSRTADLSQGLKPWVTLGELMAGQAEPDAADVVRPSPARASELAKLVPGTGLRTGGVVEYQRPSGHWGYKQDCFLADPAVPSRTIRAAATPDWWRLSDGSLRRLTWRECAGLQGFPPEWQFVGTTTSRFRQIGNAVCVPIGRAVASAIADALARGRARTPPPSAPWPPEFARRIAYTAMEERVNGPSRRQRRRVR